MNFVDTPGLYRGEIEQHSLGETKNGYPQFVARFRATEKYVDDLHELRHFHEQGVVEQKDDGTFDPQWVDWAEFDEHTTGYFVLFNDPDTFDENSKLLNYDQLQLATGWAGDEFDSLNNGTYNGKHVQFRVDEAEYQGQTQYKVNWIDDHDASPTRELQQLDQDKVKSMDQKLKMGGGKKQKAAKPSKPSQGKSGGASKTKQSSSSSSESSSKPSSKSQSETQTESTPQENSDTAQPAESDDSSSTQEQETSSAESAEQDTPSEQRLSEVTAEQAWDFVCENKGDVDDTDVEDAWINACNEVGGDKDEDDFTNAEWAQVRDHVVRSLNLNV